MIKKIVFSILVFTTITLSAQNYYRIKADFSVKVKSVNGNLSLTRGTVYYDKNFKDLIYDISFPEVEKWVIIDTTLTKIKKNNKIEVVTIPAINEFSIFHLSLNVSLNDFGLENSVYKMMRVEKKGDLVLSYWKVPNAKIENMDYIVIAKKNNELVSVVIFDQNQRIVNKQFFKDYKKYGAFKFPKKIVQISYDLENRESYQVFEFNNIIVNEVGNNEKYLYQ